MTTHILIGAGPVNLHRAKKILNNDEDAKLVIVDPRLSIDNEGKAYFDRETARANIFRVDEEVAERIAKDGVKLDDISFRVEADPKDRQAFDDDIFNYNDFDQIQIRDLQNAYLQSLQDQEKSEERSITFMTRLVPNLTTNNAHDALLEILGNAFDPNESYVFHIASGALRSEDQDSVVYPAQLAQDYSEASLDLQSMPVLPLHGTQTMRINTNKAQREFITHVFADDHRSLDHTNWQEALQKHGWSLLRPPRVRTFLNNDVLYIGAEIPQSWESLDEEEFKEKMTAYTKDIVRLTIPSGIDQFFNEGLLLPSEKPSRFTTQRGESGVGLEELTEQNISIFHHGDRRYLPHYQTGSGFITGLLINELYEGIYFKNTFDELFDWALEKKIISLAEGESREEKLDSLKESYQRNFKLEESSDPFDDSLLLKAFKADLYMAGSRDIIDENKEKVNKYFSALQKQTLAELTHHYQDEIDSIHPSASNQQKEFLALLIVKNLSEDALRELLPKLINYSDIDSLESSDLEGLRDLFYEDSLSMLELTDEECEQLKSTFEQQFQDVSEKSIPPEEQDLTADQVFQAFKDGSPIESEQLNEMDKAMIELMMQTVHDVPENDKEPAETALTHYIETALSPQQNDSTDSDRLDALNEFTKALPSALSFRLFAPNSQRSTFESKRDEILNAHPQHLQNRH